MYLAPPAGREGQLHKVLKKTYENISLNPVWRWVYTWLVDLITVPSPARVHLENLELLDLQEKRDLVGCVEIMDLLEDKESGAQQVHQAVLGTKEILEKTDLR